MYKRIKRCFFISLFSIIIPSLSYAAAYSVPACKKGDIRLPCDNNRWEFSGDALYFTDGSIDYINKTTEKAGGSIETNKEGAGYGWGFRLGTGFQVYSPIKLLLDWYHYRNSTPEVRDISGRNFATNEDIRLSTGFDIVNLSLAQKINVGEVFDLGFIEGLQFADLSYDMHLQSTSPETVVVSNILKGVGVRVGVNGAYHFLKDWALYSQFAYSLLYSRYVSTETARSPSSSVFLRTKNNFVVYENDISIGVSKDRTAFEGLLHTSVSWDAIKYGVGYATWSGLRFGMQYLA